MAAVLRGNALALPLPDNSVDLVVTSPPYFGLRSYQDAGEHYTGQIGDEPTPTEFLDALIAATAEMVRVVKPSGSIFVNLGDKYSQPGKGERNMQGIGGSIVHKAGRATPNRSAVGLSYGAPAKSLILIPERYRIRCVDELGLIARAVIVWSKPNGLPESVTDRVRRSHEDWVHFTLNPRYYSAVDEIREQAEQGRPQASRAAVLAARHGIGEEHRQALLARGLGDQGRSAATQSGTGKNTADVLRLAAEADAALGSYTREFTVTSQSLGKLPGSVWTIPTEPLHVPEWLGVDHFAAYPTEFPRRIIAGWSPRGICTVCGEGRRPVVEREPSDWQQRKAAGEPMRHGLNGAAGSNAGGFSGLTGTITGEACACPHPTAPTTPGTVLDPFGGTGTTALVADALGRHGITLDMSADYCRLAAWRTNDPKSRAKAARRDYTPPPEQTTGQLDLLEGLA